MLAEQGNLVVERAGRQVLEDDVADASVLLESLLVTQISSLHHLIKIYKLIRRSDPG